MRIVLYNPVSGPTRPLRSKLAPGPHAQNPSIASNDYHSHESALKSPGARQSMPGLGALPDKFFFVFQEIAKRPYGTAKNHSERRKSATERNAVREPVTVYFLVSQPAPYRKTYTYIAKRTYGTAKNRAERRKSATEWDAVREPTTVFSQGSGRRSTRNPTSEIRNPSSPAIQRAIITVDPKQHKSSYIRTRIRCLLFK